MAVQGRITWIPPTVLTVVQKVARAGVRGGPRPGRWRPCGAWSVVIGGCPRQCCVCFFLLKFVSWWQFCLFFLSALFQFCCVNMVWWPCVGVSVFCSLCLLVVVQCCVIMVCWQCVGVCLVLSFIGDFVDLALWCLCCLVL